MIRFGVCTSLSKSAELKAAGWDFVEENVQSLFKGAEPDEKYDGKARVASSVLPVAAANCLVPGNLKITGPAVNMDALKSYMTNVLRRAGEAGCQRLVFGSGGARQVPEGWDKNKAMQQIVEFCQMAAPISAEYGVTITLEHLNRKECNIINTLEEELQIVQRVDHPSVMALLDTFHFWVDDLAESSLLPLLPYVRHVHVADKEGRISPVAGSKSDYRRVFSLLKKAGYDGMISVEPSDFGKLPETGAASVKYLRGEWAAA